MDIVIVGSIALDDVKTPAGEVKNVLGGSAVYASLSASYYASPGIVGVVGRDFSGEHMRVLEAHGVVLDGLEKADGETFHWYGYYEKDMGTAFTRDTRLNVFASFAPNIPVAFRPAPFLFLANIHPELQLQVLDTMSGPEFILLDTMNLWIETKRQALLQVLKRVTMVVVNDAEARQLSGLDNLLQAARWIQGQGPRGVAVKKGEHGALICWEGEVGLLPAFPLDKVVDPTGAGDTFAGGLIGALAQKKQVNMDALKSAAVIGSIMASFTVEEFSIGRLAHLNEKEIRERYAHMRRLSEIKPLELDIIQGG
ncbi:sugar kinase [candidate division FCPU426 bacterium]|nr:sugar kinase [candidate division FCPU426 bacterium]